MFNYLHDETRTTDPALWRANLESVFDVDGFLKYLAVNNTIQNWDTYGRMEHNYYLYHDPVDGLIKWIVWDNNEAFQVGKMGGSLSFGMTEIGTDWPLIKFTVDDTVYFDQYKAHVKSFIESSFAASRMDGIYSDKQTLLQSFADDERSGYSYVNGQFSSAISDMKSHNVSRVTVATAFVQ
jgi:spore coat protein CotH